MRLNLIVIKTNRLSELAEFYSWLGLTFEYHRHEQGVFHYSGVLEKMVFEIYPLPKTQPIADTTTRLGFTVQKLDHLIQDLKGKNVRIIAEPRETEFGKMAVIEDLDGRKIELSENGG